ncbi:hypothetical protein PIB30_093342 [Stylosanthes scabra]|uniref:Uncharacterized protein n=1 Tax=Stylosanthes scabra TaxID=79078 RepID=A0ABU6XT04_9FABA|nr:hypothetical protein [Stylosanthes scabra]
MDNSESISNSSISNEIESLATMVREESKMSYYELANKLSQKFYEILNINVAENIQKNVKDPIIRQIPNMPPPRMDNDIHQDVENSAWDNMISKKLLHRSLNRSGFDIRSVNQVRLIQPFQILSKKCNCPKVGKSPSHFLYFVENTTRNALVTGGFFYDFGHFHRYRGIYRRIFFPGKNGDGNTLPAEF